MASITVNGLDEVMKKLEKLSDKSRVDEIAKKAVSAALPTLEGSVRSHVHPSRAKAGVITKDAKVNEYGVFGVVTIAGKDSKGESLAKLANILEYGRHDGKGAHIPWRSASASAVESTCQSIMEDIVNAEMELD